MIEIRKAAIIPAEDIEMVPNITPLQSEEKSVSMANTETPIFNRYRFVNIRVKRQLYSGKPSIAVFFSDVTKKII